MQIWSQQLPCSGGQYRGPFHLITWNIEDGLRAGLLLAEETHLLMVLNYSGGVILEGKITHISDEQQSQTKDTSWLLMIWGHGGATIQCSSSCSKLPRGLLCRDAPIHLFLDWFWSWYWNSGYWPIPSTDLIPVVLLFVWVELLKIIPLGLI